jgi:adenylylsulfate kinase
MKLKSFAIWLTGLPGSGKSVISESLKKILEEHGISSQILRMDEMRKFVTPEPKYTDEERQLIYNAFSFTANLLVENDINVIMDGTGNLRKYRALAKEIIPNYLEIYLKCPLDIAIAREEGRNDTKEAPENIYKRAKKGETKTVPGLQVEYEEPLEPDLIVETNILGIKESAEKIFSTIKSQFQQQ